MFNLNNETKHEPARKSLLEDYGSTIDYLLTLKEEYEKESDPSLRAEKWEEIKDYIKSKNLFLCKFILKGLYIDHRSF